MARNQFAVFSAHGIDAVVAVAQHGGNFIGVKSRAIDHAARFDGFLGALRGITLVSPSGKGHRDGIRARIEPHDARAR